MKMKSSCFKNLFCTPTGKKEISGSVYFLLGFLWVHSGNPFTCHSSLELFLFESEWFSSMLSIRSKHHTEVSIDIPGSLPSLTMASPTIQREHSVDEVDQPNQTEDHTQISAEHDAVDAKPTERSTLRRVRIQKKNRRYYFQHPYFRLFTAYFVIFCNFLIYAEDPVSHSVSPCTLPVLGNVYSFVVNRYPSGGWAALKVFMWVIGLIIGLVVGKFLIHKILLKKLLRLSMFQEDKGSWMIMFLTTIMLLFIFSVIFNAFIGLGGSSLAEYKVTSFLGFVNKTFMKAAGMGTWMGDFVTAWMVTDMMLQDKLYPHWNKRLRRWWTTGWNRIVMFWVVLVFTTVIVATAITTDFLKWDYLNRDFITTNELSRAFLASFILICDLSIVMQDWEFPLFQGSLDIKLPGINVPSISFSLPRFLNRENWAVHITGKWFNYGIIMLVIILDLNMWKNQIFYSPFDFGQYTNSHGYIFTIEDREFLKVANKTMVSWEWRNSHATPYNQSATSIDPKMNSKYLGFPLGVKAIAFIPSIAAFIIFALLIWFYGREEFVVEKIVVDGAPIEGIIVESMLISAKTNKPIENKDLFKQTKSEVPSEEDGPPPAKLMKITYV